VRVKSFEVPEVLSYKINLNEYSQNPLATYPLDTIRIL